MRLSTRVIKTFDAIFNGICRFFGIRLSVHTRALSPEEVKALGLDKIEAEKPTAM